MMLLEEVKMTNNSRRTFIAAAAVTGAALFVPSLLSAKEKNKAQDKVTPTEDLMREHGVLKRVLLIYEEAATRLQADNGIPGASIHDAAEVIRHFIEDYHEKLEEDFLFPRFRRAHKLIDLVDVLAEQHQAGRALTDLTLHLSKSPSLKAPDERRKLALALRRFVRMYNPHEAREDTVLFPALRTLVSEHEYDALGEDFERKEHQLFGSDGFEMMVDKVAGIEKQLGIYDLARFTPNERDIVSL
jgi:hemerythrin-like domain-containing protein